jgi:hypothetical protein
VTHHYTLTPADIMDLRASLPGGRMRDGTAQDLAPCVVYGPSSDEYYLHANGYVWASSPRIEVVAAAMRAERLESGWLMRALASQETCVEALLNPDERAALRRRRAEAEARERLALATRSDLASTNLDDFL